MADTRLKVQYPDIIMAAKVKLKLDAWTEMAPGEFSCMGLLEEVRDDTNQIKKLKVTEVFLVNQKNTGASTELDDHALGELCMKLASEGNGDEGRLKAWIHSHANMDVYWSPTDETCITGLLLSNESHVVSIVVNKKGEHRTRLDVVHPAKIVFDNLPLEIEKVQTNPYWEECKSVYEAKAENVEARFSSKSLGSASKQSSTTNKTPTSGATACGPYSDYDEDAVDAMWNQHRTAAESTASKASESGEKKSSDQVRSESSGTLRPEVIDIFDKEIVVLAFPQLDAHDIELLAMGHEISIFDEERYEEILNELIHGKSLDQVIDEAEYVQCEAAYKHVNYVDDPDSGYDDITLDGLKAKARLKAQSGEPSAEFVPGEAEDTVEASADANVGAEIEADEADEAEAASKPDAAAELKRYHEYLAGNKNNYSSPLDSDSTDDADGTEDSDSPFLHGSASGDSDEEPRIEFREFLQDVITDASQADWEKFPHHSLRIVDHVKANAHNNTLKHVMPTELIVRQPSESQEPEEVADSDVMEVSDLTAQDESEKTPLASFSGHSDGFSSIGMHLVDRSRS